MSDIRAVSPKLEDANKHNSGRRRRRPAGEGHLGGQRRALAARRTSSSVKWPRRLRSERSAANGARSWRCPWRVRCGSVRRIRGGAPSNRASAAAGQNTCRRRPSTSLCSRRRRRVGCASAGVMHFEENCRRRDAGGRHRVGDAARQLGGGRRRSVDTDHCRTVDTLARRRNRGDAGGVGRHVDRVPLTAHSPGNRHHRRVRGRPGEGAVVHDSVRCIARRRPQLRRAGIELERRASGIRSDRDDAGRRRGSGAVAVRHQQGHRTQGEKQPASTHDEPFLRPRLCTGGACRGHRGNPTAGRRLLSTPHACTWTKYTPAAARCPLAVSRSHRNVRPLPPSVRRSRRRTRRPRTS